MHVKRGVCAFGSSVPRPFTAIAIQAAAALGHAEPVLGYVPWGEEINWLTSGRVDLVLVQSRRGLADGRLDLVPLSEMRRMAVFAARHPLAGKPSVRISDLQHEPIIDAASERDDWIVNPRPDGESPVIVGPAARTVDEMLASVSASRRMAITSSSVAFRYQSADLAFVPITDLDSAMLYLASDTSERRPEIAAMRTETASLVRESADGAPWSGAIAPSTSTDPHGRVTSAFPALGCSIATTPTRPAT